MPPAGFDSPAGIFSLPDHSPRLLTTSGVSFGSNRPRDYLERKIKVPVMSRSEAVLS